MTEQSGEGGGKHGGDGVTAATSAAGVGNRSKETQQVVQRDGGAGGGRNVRFEGRQYS